MKVSVAIPTVDRTMLLKAAVAAVLGQSVLKEELEILIVDNSPDRKQAWVAAAFPQQDRTGRPLLRYLSEPRPGLASARNCSVKAALGDYIVFLDDDERPCNSRWLENLLDLAQSKQADAVFGPVLPRFEREPARYGTFANRLYTRQLVVADGADITNRYHYVGSGNSCFRMATCFRIPDLQFDLRFDAYGGEDTEMFRRLVHRGCRFVWSAKAAVEEFVPEARTQLSELKARRFAKGQNRSFMQIATAPARPAWLLFWMAAGVAQTVYHSTAAVALGIGGWRDAANVHAIEAFGGLGKIFWQRRFRAQRYAQPYRGEMT